MSENNSSSGGGGLVGCFVLIAISVIVGLLLSSYGFSWQESVGAGLAAGVGLAVLPTVICFGLIFVIIAGVVIFAMVSNRR